MKTSVVLDLESLAFRKLLAQLTVYPITLEIARQSAALDFRADPADELIAATHSVEEIRRHIGADSLAYLSIEGMMAALTDDDADGLGGPDDGPAGGAVTGYCNACFTGHYPFESVPVELGRKDVFDGVLADADHEAATAAPVGLRP